VHNNNIIDVLSNFEESNYPKKQKSQTSNNADIRTKTRTNPPQLFNIFCIEWAPESISSSHFHFTLNRRRPHILGKIAKTETNNNKRKTRAGQNRKKH